MTFEQWLTRLDPGQVSFSVLCIIAIGLFIWRKVWPWLVSDYWPSRVKRLEAMARAQDETERERTALLALIRDALVELKVIAAQQMEMMQRQRQEMGTVANTLLTQQREILDRVEMVHQEMKDYAAGG